MVGSNTDIHFAHFRFKFTILSHLNAILYLLYRTDCKMFQTRLPILYPYVAGAGASHRKLTWRHKKGGGPLFPQTRNRFNTSITVVHFSTSLYLPLVKGDYLVMEEGHCKLHVARKVRLFCNFFDLCKGLLWASSIGGSPIADGRQK